MVNDSKPVIAVLIDWVTVGYQSELIKGIEEEAHKRGINILYLPGRPFETTQGFGKLCNRIYELIDRNYIDGIIIPITVMDFIKTGEADKYMNRFSPIPIVTLTFKCKQAFSVNIDNGSGFRALLEHMINRHECTQFAFIHGPKDHLDAIERYRIYKEVLASHQILPDENKTVYGDFIIKSGIKAVGTLLDERKLKLRKDIEVIICSNDAMAIGVIRELENRGLSVPGDVAVTGFDDIEASKRMLVQITTVHYPIRELGREGVKVLALKKESGKLLQTQFLPRESCGCVLSGIKDKYPVPPEGEEEFREFLLLEVCKILFVSKLPEWDSILPGKFIDWFLSPLPENKLPGLKAEIYFFFISWIKKWKDLTGWPAALKFLEDNIPPGENGCRKRLFQYSYIILSKLSLRAEILRITKILDIEKRLGWVNGGLRASNNLDNISLHLSQRLPDLLNINSCYLFLYTDAGDITHDFELLNYLKNREGQGHQIIKNFETILQTFMPRDKRASFFIMPLLFHSWIMGFCFIEYHPDLLVCYERLHMNISTALNHSLTIIESENRSRKLKEFQGRLVQSAHQAGMAQIAINLMHTIGNILNSGTIAIDVAINKIKKSVFFRYQKANRLIQDNKDNLASFFQTDPRGRILPEYYRKLEGIHETENREMVDDLNKLGNTMMDISKVIDAQMELSEGIFISESINLVESLENCLFLKNEALEKAEVRIIKEYESKNSYIISCYQNKLLHIFAQLIEFAIYGAMKSSDKAITLSLEPGNKKILLTISHSGEGINKTNLVKLFHPDFLLPGCRENIDFHFIANSLSEIRAVIKVESGGRGISVLISFPLTED